MIPEKILVWAEIGIFLLRIIVIHGRHQGNAGLRKTPGHAVDIGDQSVAQLHGGPRWDQRIFAKRPGSSILIGILGAVQPENGAEDSKLHPTRIQFWIFNPSHMATDIMAPPAKGHIGCRGGKIGLESQGFPGNDRISGETDRVAVIAQPAPTGEDKGSHLSSAPEVVKMEVIEPP